MNLLKIFTALAAILVGATVMASAPLAVSNASAAPVPLIKCQSMQSVPNTSIAPIQLSGCNRPRVTGGSGTTNSLGPGPPILWMTQKSMHFGTEFGGFPSTIAVQHPSSSLILLG